MSYFKMKKIILIIFLLQVSFSAFSQEVIKKENDNSIFIYVEKSHLNSFKFLEINLKKETHFKLSWPTNGNYKKNILNKSENGQVEKSFTTLNGRSYNLHLKSKNEFSQINEKDLIQLLKNKNVIYFSEFNLYDSENLFKFLESNYEIYLIKNDFKNKIKIYKCEKLKV